MKALTGVALAILLLFFGTTASAETGAKLTSRPQLEAWMDGAMNAYLADHRYAGGVVAVVADGKLFFSKGYGYADIATRKRVDPEKTLFRIGSVSKLFVWTSVMQLVEQGKLDLDADVNTYLTDLKVPAKFGEPVTMSNLMSHTPGFEDHFIGLFRRDASGMAPLRDVLDEEIPKRVRPPGKMASYSNHGTGIAARVLEEISGVPWEQYIQENILDPLKMTQITFAQPVPEALAEDLSKGYRRANGTLKEESFEFIPLGPVGSGSASAEGMANFMIAHLQAGKFGNTRILEEETALQMHSELNRMAAGVNPMAHGFIDMSRNGERIIGHGGSTRWFKTSMALLPEHNVGVFFSFNTDTGGAARASIQRQFLDDFFPGEEPGIIEPPFGFDDHAGKYVGSYRPNRRSYTTFTKFASAFSTITVTPSGDGALLLSSTGAKRWIEIGPLTFREEHGPERIVFVEDQRGRISHLLFAEGPTVAFDKNGLFDRPVLHRSVLFFSMGLFALTLVMWPATSFLRWKYDALMPAHERFPFAPRFAAWLISAIFLTFIVGVFNSLVEMNEVVFGVPQFVDRLLWLPMPAIALTVVAAIYTFLVWRNGKGRIVSRLYYTLFTIATLVFIWQLFYWNLIGHQY